MSLNKLKNSKGFTLIEIVLVMAIAALILIIVFLAVTGAQRGRRDTQRRSDGARYLAAVEQWASNHDGRYPANGLETTSVRDLYILNGSQFADPSDGVNYDVTGYGPPDPGAGAYHIIRSVQGTCTNGNLVAGAARTYAVSIFQENGGHYCVHN